MECVPRSNDRGERYRATELQRSYKRPLEKKGGEKRLCMIVIDMIMIQMNVMPIAIYALKFSQ